MMISVCVMTELKLTGKQDVSNETKSRIKLERVQPV